MSILLSVSVKFYSIPCQKQQQEEKTKTKNPQDSTIYKHLCS